MKRRKVVITIEAETVLTIAQLRGLTTAMFIPNDKIPRTIDVNKLAEKKGTSSGTITQVQVNVIK